MLREIEGHCTLFYKKFQKLPGSRSMRAFAPSHVAKASPSSVTAIGLRAAA